MNNIYRKNLPSFSESVYNPSIFKTLFPIFWFYIQQSQTILHVSSQFLLLVCPDSDRVTHSSSSSCVCVLSHKTRWVCLRNKPKNVSKEEEAHTHVQADSGSLTCVCLQWVWLSMCVCVILGVCVCYSFPFFCSCVIISVTPWNKAGTFKVERCGWLGENAVPTTATWGHPEKGAPELDQPNLIRCGTIYTI